MSHVGSRAQSPRHHNLRYSDSWAHCLGRVYSGVGEALEPEPVSLAVWSQIGNVPTSTNLDGLCVNQGFEVRGCDTRVVTMGCSVLLIFKERPSFEGELSISLNEECDSQGHEKYFVVCQKKPPLNAKEFAIFAASLNRMDGQALEVITESINWQREVPPSEAKKLTAAMEHQAVSVAPEGVLGLDGTTYELLIERGFNRIQYTWWGEPPAAWRPLRKLSNTLLGVADAASRIEHLQSNTRKRLIQQLQEQLEEEQAKLNSQTSELTKTNNKRCLELAESLSKAGLTCPNCGVLSSDIRFVDKSTAGRSYFICQACGRSFRPEDL